MIDLHTHTLFSDGVLIPSEHVRRAVVHGYSAIAMTDHADFTNFEWIISSLEKAKYLEKEWEITVLSGIEITHVPPAKIDELARKAKEAGADIVVVHGETIVEPVASGTNLASVQSKYVDILAHPGFLTIEEAELARENDICIEITARSGHNRTNGHVAKVATEAKAKIVCNTDAHNPGDMITKETAQHILRGAGLSEKQAENAFLNSAELVKTLRKY
ncbi:histidinol phosphate phosphatase domain-containing protein [Methanolapillus millepedarum]|uniref:Polymerase/histidinol phosphatase N-terminal domain-containing protein n=1 Tax=Methanolapillus millepedarum TaxID=3028296 RepID=A0AA96V335_9EURY|nr:hypothetical protein MsAc7_05510 [Methanosarcinaceae archaeon Ac7]